MLLHLQVLFRRELAGLVQQLVGHADLADVVQRRQARQQIDALRRQVIAKRRVLRQLLGEQPAVLLDAPRMAAGIGVAHLGQRQQRSHHQALGEVLLASGAIRSPAAPGRCARASRRRARPSSRSSERTATGIAPSPTAASASPARPPPGRPPPAIGAERQADPRHQQRDGDARARARCRPRASTRARRATGSRGAADCRRPSPAPRPRRTACRAASTPPPGCRAPSSRRRRWRS